MAEEYIRGMPCTSPGGYRCRQLLSPGVGAVSQKLAVQVSVGQLELGGCRFAHHCFMVHPGPSKHHSWELPIW